jgi:hypothetical protein
VVPKSIPTISLCVGGADAPRNLAAKVGIVGSTDFVRAERLGLLHFASGRGVAKSAGQV